MLVVVMVTSCQ